MHNYDERELIKHWGEQLDKGRKAALILEELDAIFDKMEKSLYNLWLNRPIDGWDEIYWKKKALEELKTELKRAIDDAKVAEQKIEEVVNARKNE